MKQQGGRVADATGEAWCRADPASGPVFETPQFRVDYCDAAAAPAIDAIVADPAVAGSFFPPGRRTAVLLDSSRWVLGSDDWGVHRVAYFAARDRAIDMPTGLLGVAGTEICFCIKREYWGRGLATELVGGFCENARAILGLSRLSARVSRANVGSRTVVERCGFRFAGLVSIPSLSQGPPEMALHYIVDL